MKIAIDALGIHGFGGGRSATLNLLEALFAQDTQNEYLVILTKPESTLDTPAGNVNQWIAPVTNRFATRLWAQATFPFALRGYDVVHFIKNLGVFGLSAPTVVTIYDMTTLVHPDLFPRSDVLYWKSIQRLTVRSAAKIIAISENTARDVAHFYGVGPQAIRMIYPGYAGHFAPASAADVDRVRRHYGLPEHFVVHVGRIDRKKNLSLLIRAFASVQATLPPGTKLVFVGEEYAKSRDAALSPLIHELGLDDQVLFTGPAPDRDLPGILGAATVDVFCSLHEGFGIVALEAMACGVPLIVTPAGAVTEVVGDAAIIVDPDDPQPLADALVRTFADPALRAEMRRKGLAQIQQFSWQTAAQETLALYQEISSKAPRP